VVWSSLYPILAPESAGSGGLVFGLVCSCMHNMKRGSQNQMDGIHHRVAPQVCQWFISLARKEPFTAAIWKASGDVGYQGYLDFLLGKDVGVATPCNNSRIRMASHPQPERCGNGHEAKLIVRKIEPFTV
ncbi:hypothetical protein EMCRGX_G006239, partial [Ephydatia muelleri]